MPLGKRSDFGDARYAGVEVPFSHDISHDMQVCVCACLLLVVC